MSQVGQIWEHEISCTPGFAQQRPCIHSQISTTRSYRTAFLNAACVLPTPFSAFLDSLLNLRRLRKNEKKNRRRAACWRHVALQCELRESDHSRPKVQRVPLIHFASPLGGSSCYCLRSRVGFYFALRIFPRPINRFHFRFQTSETPPFAKHGQRSEHVASCSL